MPHQKQDVVPGLFLRFMVLFALQIFQYIIRVLINDAGDQEKPGVLLFHIIFYRLKHLQILFLHMNLSEDFL